MESWLPGLFNTSRAQVSFIMRYGYQIAGTDGWFDADMWTDVNVPDAAILEFIDGDDACLRFARRLAGMGIPTLFYTSRESIRCMPADLRIRPCLEEPDRFNLLLKPLATMLNERFVQEFRGVEVFA